ncbi:50S ribosomal protein L29 [Murdochiella massiliensis]|uniref:50S ribosomal protein L29 n=1 Tax=Murdochiella massiliensis TaxID=1673723 RepID=UPI00082FF463|nr:50S ribosomal protein L29 [Murdochiella massiliensis]MBY0584002.1 50S ribosomal protein L29 [Murdochiella sp. Marseille-P8839]
MKATEIRNLSDQDLSQKLQDLKQELFNLRFQIAAGQLENPNAIGSVKKDIARVRTIQQERALAARKEA